MRARRPAFAAEPAMAAHPHVQRHRIRPSLGLLVPLFALLALLATLAGVPSAQAGERGRFLAAYDGLLKAHVRPARQGDVVYNGVDYRAWAADPRHAEARALLLASTPPEGPRDAQLAYWINAYNFLTVELIVRSGEQGSIKNLGNLLQSPWRRHVWPLAGQERSLDDIEHGIIRRIGDARIHFAINCAAISCPDLRGEAYRSDRLAAQLDDQVVRTLANPSKGLRRLGPDAVAVSKVMDWFEEDFDGGDLRGWLSRVGGVALGESTQIRFLDYDWALNRR